MEHVGICDAPVIHDVPVTTQPHKDPEGIQRDQRPEFLWKPQGDIDFVHSVSR
jgi:hypothetical protein